MDDNKKDIDLISWLLDVPNWEHYEHWLLDPKNKSFLDELKDAAKEKGGIRIDLDELEK